MAENPNPEALSTRSAILIVLKGQKKLAHSGSLQKHTPHFADHSHPRLINSLNPIRIVLQPLPEGDGKKKGPNRMRKGKMSNQAGSSPGNGAPIHQPPSRTRRKPAILILCRSAAVSSSKMRIAVPERLIIREYRLPGFYPRKHPIFEVIRPNSTKSYIKNKLHGRTGVPPVSTLPWSLDFRQWAAPQVLIIQPRSNQIAPNPRETFAPPTLTTHHSSPDTFARISLSLGALHSNVN